MGEKGAWGSGRKKKKKKKRGNLFFFFFFLRIGKCDSGDLALLRLGARRGLLFFASGVERAAFVVCFSDFHWKGITWFTLCGRRVYPFIEPPSVNFCSRTDANKENPTV